PVIHPQPPTPSYTPSLHDALPIFQGRLALVDRRRTSDTDARPAARQGRQLVRQRVGLQLPHGGPDHLHGGEPLKASISSVDVAGDRKSTRLNSSHEWISYAVFCLK